MNQLFYSRSKIRGIGRLEGSERAFDEVVTAVRRAACLAQHIVSSEEFMELFDRYAEARSVAP